MNGLLRMQSANSMAGNQADPKASSALPLTGDDQ